jgi:integrase/recombinase XerC
LGLFSGKKNGGCFGSIYPSFIDYLKFEKRYSAHTIRSYRDDLEAFGLCGDEFGGLELKEVSPAVVRSWLASMKDAGA